MTLSSVLEALDTRHLVHPHQTLKRPDRRVFLKGSGSLVWDSDGVEYLDMAGAGNWVSQVGHARPEMAEAAAAQINQLEFFSCWREFSNEPAIRLAARLADLSPGDLNKVFYTVGGSDGTDTAIKIARRYFFETGEPDRTWIIGRFLGYHGTTLGSGSVTGFDDMHLGAGPLLPHVERVMPPVPYHQEMYGGADPTDFLIGQLEATISRIGPGNIAAMIGEPILGGAGVVVPPADYWPRVREVLSKHGILLIADEVITAFGRTGAWFASEQFGMDPDIVIVAKGLTSGYAPLGAVLMRDHIGEAISTGETHFFHGQTFYGHPLSCTIAMTNLDIMEKENLLGAAITIGDWFREGLAPAASLPIVGDIRVHGAMIGIELVSNRETKEMLAFDQVFNIVDDLRITHKILVRDYGPTLVVGPSLVASHDQVTRTTAGLIDVLTKASRRLMG